MNIDQLSRICAWLGGLGVGCSALAQQVPGWQFDRDVNRGKRQRARKEMGDAGQKRRSSNHPSSLHGG